MENRITTLKDASTQKLADIFHSRKAELPGGTESRKAAFDSFSNKGLPNKRVEEFKYTDIRALLGDVAPLALRPDATLAKAAFASAKLFAGIDAYRIALIDGHAFLELSNIKGIEVVSLADALASGNALLSKLNVSAKAAANPLFELNSAFMTDGVIIRIAEGVKLDKPLHLSFVAGTEAVATASRVLIIVEDGADVTLLESHESRDGLGLQLNDVVEFIIGDHARVEHVRINAEGREALAFSTLTARVGTETNFTTFNMGLGAKAARHQVYLSLDGQKSNVQVNGAMLLNGAQHSDATLVADHNGVGCISRELFKTIIDDNATGVFQGRINVDAEAQKTDGKMMSGCLLLSDNGTMYNKPELEIFADDVQCGHGATCGALDDNLLFYIESRGVPRAEAESLLIQAFVGEAVETVTHDDAKDELIGLVVTWLKQRG